MKTKLIIVIGLVTVIAVAAWPQRVLLQWGLMSVIGPLPSLSDKTNEPARVQWFDDYYTLEYIDDKTIAIGEPRYWQVNYNYLILGEERAILFDSGPGVRDIKPLVASLTDLPVTVVASHLHFDHVGNHNRFQHIAMLDVPSVRAKAEGDVVQTSHLQHLGFLERIANPPLTVSQWWQPGQRIDLGGRELQVINAPGHTPDSLMLWDEQRNLLLAGDYIYDGELYAMMPGSDLAEYEKTAAGLLTLINSQTKLLTAHRTTAQGAPILGKQDLVDLHQALVKIRQGQIRGEGWFVKVYPINDSLILLTN